MWTITDSEIIITAIGNKKVYLFDKNFYPIKTLETFGLPVFTSISIDEKYLVVIFSRDSFLYLQIFNLQNYNQEEIFKFNGKILHAKWSNENPYLYVSVNDRNNLTVLEKIFGVKNVLLKL